jgi:hypothetical protein
MLRQREMAAYAARRGAVESRRAEDRAVGAERAERRRDALHADFIDKGNE